jgi:hypothetical protein
MTKEKGMSKVVVSLGYRSIVLEASKAVALAELLQDAESYEAKWHSKTDTKDSYNSYHIYPLESDGGSFLNMQLITDDAYRMYKLAGKPSE